MLVRWAERRERPLAEKEQSGMLRAGRPQAGLLEHLVERGGKQLAGKAQVERRPGEKIWGHRIH